ncbi:hypothetical protein B0I35DRAFT_478263 [Stachybotrys elegans]|uniref:DUF1746 domain-containing protein n=1 Tax=Stachybotrys elegans TaxID=80388 RepID=A0A8K0WRA9_9HYPO|nr:hypothetical protein B0I35DRAFT_478263 [Stachybotrys elegans]
MSPDDGGPSSTAEPLLQHLAARPRNDDDDVDVDVDNDNGDRQTDPAASSQHSTRRRHAASSASLRPESRSRQDAAVDRARRRQKKSRKRRNPGLAKKLAFLSHLLKSLDLIVFAELSALYYMECSLFRFLLRAIGQIMCLTPKDPTFPIAVPSTRMHVLMILIPNFICLLLHLFSAPPVGPDYHRGYQHGGLIIDFIGQRPPAWRIYYMLADLFILSVQCLMIAIHSERENLRVALKTFRPISQDVARELAPAQTMEALDAEERGVLRDNVLPTLDETNDVEMQPLISPNGADNSQRIIDEAESTNDGLDESPGSHLNDLLCSGNAIIGEYRVTQALRLAFSDNDRGASALRSLGYEATLATLQAQRRAAMVDTLAGTQNR